MIDIALCDRHSTDKSKYAEFYDELFTPIKDSVTKILEIGVWHGNSVRMWLESFPNAHVDGVDNHSEVPEGVLQHIQESDRFKLWEGNQQDAAFLAQVSKAGPWDIIIDDGSHDRSGQTAAFYALNHCLRTGGYYIIEDLHPNDSFGWLDPGVLTFVGLKKSPMTGEGFAIYTK